MAKVSVQTLSGTALDYAVALCEKLPIRKDPMGFKSMEPNCSQAGYWVWDDAVLSKYRCEIIGQCYSPSTKWAQAGAFIERFTPDMLAQWVAIKASGADEGETLLVVAMRLYVQSVMGDELELPQDLLTA